MNDRRNAIEAPSGLFRHRVPAQGRVGIGRDQGAVEEGGGSLENEGYSQAVKEEEKQEGQEELR